MRAGRDREPRPAAPHPVGVRRDAGASGAAGGRASRRTPRAPARHEDAAVERAEC